MIVTGSTFVLDENPCAEPAEPQPNSDKGRPTIQRTRSLKPFSEVFPGALASGYSSTPVLAEAKTILYAYEDRRFLDEILPPELIEDYNAVIGQSFGLQSNEPLFAATIKKQPFGYLFPDAGANANMVIGEVILETPKTKAIWRPKGALSGLDEDLTLILAAREDLTTKFLPSVPQSSPEADPKTGNHTCYEQQPKKEEPQIQAQRPLREVPVVGRARTTYSGWVPVVSYDLVLSFGFLPDAAVANNLARQIARQQERRRDGWLVKMPIPDEWAAIGYRPLSLCRVGTKTLQIDAPIISLFAGAASLEFEGGSLDTSAIELIDVLAGAVSEALVYVSDYSVLLIKAGAATEASVTISDGGLPE